MKQLYSILIVLKMILNIKLDNESLFVYMLYIELFNVINN